MAHFALLWKARTIEKYRQNYENEKINSILMSNENIPEKTLFQRWRHYSHGMQKRLSRTFSRWYPEGTTVSNFFVSLRADMKLPSILLRSLYGFIGGLLLTYLGFMFFVFQLSLSLMHATVLSSVLGVLLTLGLTFSNRMRYLIFLLVPQLFSRVGRYTLTCYALVLILTGPATNTLKNSEVLSESMACSQEQVKISIRQINESMKKPFNSIKDSLKITLNSMRLAVRKLKAALIRTNRLILSIASVIQSGYSWIDSVAKKCNERLGTPYDKCIKTINTHVKNFDEHLESTKTRKDIDRVEDIRETLDIIDLKDLKVHKVVKHFKKPKDKMNFKKREDRDNIKKINDNDYFKIDKDNVKNDIKSHDRLPWFCNAAYVADIACASLTSFDKFCVAADFVEETFLATIRRKLKVFIHRLSSLIYVKLNIHHTYVFIGNSSSSNQIAAGIVTEIRNRADPILTWLSWSSCVTSLFLLLIIFRAKHYQYMFETRSRFDNRFITKEFRELDLKRLRERRETVLPLNRRERAKYVTTTSFRLVASEKVHLNRSAVFMTITTFKLLIHIVADYSLYWVLMTIRHHGKLQLPLQPGIADSGAFISGSGFVARLLQSFIDSLSVQLSLPPPDNACLPNPYPPDVKRYCQIGFLIFLLWFFALFEPYGLRLRHLIMGHYRPERAKARAVWLYNHILRTRVSFMKFARRKLHREYKYSSQTALTFRHWLQAHIPFCCLRSLLGIGPEEPRCLLCNITERESDTNTELIRCEVTKCPGTYCMSCFSDIGQLCTICLSPSDYGDFSDVSLEKGSSDDDSDGDDHDSSYPSTKGRRTNDETTFKDDCDDTVSKTSKFDRRRLSRVIESDGEQDNETLPLLHRNTSNTGHRKLHDLNRYSYDQIAQYLLCKSNLQSTLSPHNSTETIIAKERNKTIQSLKDHNNNDLLFGRVILALNSIDSFQFGLYEIKIVQSPLVITKIQSTTTLAKYLRKNKIIRCKKKGKVIRNNNGKYFMTYGNSVNEAKHTNTPPKDTGKPEKSKEIETKKKKLKKTDLNNTPNNKSKSTGNKNHKQKSNEPKADACKVHNRVYDFFLKPWKNPKLNAQTTTKLTDTRKDFAPSEAKKHKRKKKRKNKINDIPKRKNREDDSKKFKAKNKQDLVDNSPLFAYLDEWDWIKNDIDSQDHNIKNENACKENFVGQKEEIVQIVNNVQIPRLKLELLSDSFVESEQGNSSNEDLAMRDVNTTSKTSMKSFAKAAIDRFFKSIIPFRIKTTSSSKRKTSRKNNPRSFSTLFKVKSKKDLYKHTDLKMERTILPNADAEIGFRLDSFSGYGLSRPLSLIKTVYSSLLLRLKLGNEETMVEKDNIMQRAEADDKSIIALPPTNTCACQNNFRNVETEDFSIQVEDTHETNKDLIHCYDVQINAVQKTCTCATQYQNITRDVGTCSTYRLNGDIETKETSNLLDSDTAHSSSETQTSDRSDEPKSDFTVRTNVSYCAECRARDNKARRLLVKVVTKSNRSTITDKAEHCNVSTATQDWWSPLVEKKNVEDRYERKRRDYEIVRERERRIGKYNNRMSPKERMVNFRSSTQVIPSVEPSDNDIMSPSRYLLESQKYYNELYCSKFKINRMFPVAHFQKHQNQAKSRSQVSSRHQSHRGRKTKRLEQSYSPRNQINQRENEKKATESARKLKSPRRNRQNK